MKIPQDYLFAVTRSGGKIHLTLDGEYSLCRGAVTVHDEPNFRAGDICRQCMIRLPKDVRETMRGNP